MDARGICPHLIASALCGTPSAALPSVGSASVLRARPGSRLHGSPAAVTAKLPCARGLATCGTDRCLVNGNLSNVPAVASLHHARDIIRLFIPLYFRLLAAVVLGRLWLEAPKCHAEWCRALRLCSSRGLFIMHQVCLGCFAVPG